MSDIKKLYVEIILMLVVIFVTIPIWKNFNRIGFFTAQKYSSDAIEKYYSSINVSCLLNSVSDEYAIRNIATQNIIINDIHDNEKKHNLILKFNKFSQLNINDLKINVNYNIDYLNRYHYYEDENNYYFVIDRDNLLNKKYILSLWIDEKSASNGDLLEYQLIIM